MKVNNDAAIQQALQSYGSKRLTGSDTARSNAANAAAGARSDEISISTEGQELQKAIRAAQQSDEARAERVAEIRTKMRTGAYALDPKMIANRMLGIINGES